MRNGENIRKKVRETKNSLEKSWRNVKESCSGEYSIPWIKKLYSWIKIKKYVINLI